MAKLFYNFGCAGAAMIVVDDAGNFYATLTGIDDGLRDGRMRSCEHGPLYAGRSAGDFVDEGFERSVTVGQEPKVFILTNRLPRVTSE